jgi:hypothetical protein
MEVLSRMQVSCLGDGETVDREGPMRKKRYEFPECFLAIGKRRTRRMLREVNDGVRPAYKSRWKSDGKIRARWRTCAKLGSCPVWAEQYHLGEEAGSGQGKERAPYTAVPIVPT